jgi:ligand-binding sensor domain-containing protein/putative methionine-R-sulfoxide reductase with GAF domain
MAVQALYRLAAFAIIAIATNYPAFAQLPDYQLRMLQEQQGLKTSDLRAITRDKEGFLWIATQSYVQRFDGRQTLQYPFSETIREIIVDSQNRKWALTANSIHLLSDAFKGFKKVEFDSSQAEPIVHVYETGGGKFWVAKKNQHYVYDDGGGFFKASVSLRLPENLAYTFFYGERGYDWIMRKDDSIYCYNYHHQRLWAVYMKPTYSVIPYAPGQVLVSTTGYKTFCVDMNTGQTLSLSADDPALLEWLVVFEAIMLDANRMLVSSNKGLLEFDTQTRRLSKKIFYYNGRPLENQQTVRQLYKDETGTIYMSHADGIFFMQRGAAIQYIRSYRYGNVAIQDNDVRNFAEDEQGDIWMATTNGIARMDMQSGKLQMYSPLNSREFVNFPSYRQLLHDSNYLWIGTSGNGLWRMNKRTGKYERPFFAITAEGRKADSLMSTTYVWKILKLRSGQILVVGGTRAFVVEPRTLMATQVHFESAKWTSRSAFQDSAGRIWHGTTRGLSCMDGNFNTLFLIQDSFPDKRVAAFCEWKANSLFVGTRGLYEVQVQDSRITSFRKRNGMPADRFIYCMQKDLQGYIWLGTDEGIFRYNPVTDEAVGFNESDNVQSQIFNSDGAYLTRSGLVFLGGLNGVNFFDPSLVRPYQEPLTPVITYFATGNGNTSRQLSAGVVDVPYADRDIHLSFVSPEFGRPFRIHYRYKLQNNQAGWSYTGTENNIRISNLLPGNYEVSVSASYDGRKWFDNNSAFRFTIIRPWWQSWWFRLLGATFALAVAWRIMRYRRRRRQSAEMKKTIEYFANSGTRHSSAEDILWDIARNCISRLGLEDCVIYLVDDERQVLVQKAAYGDKSPQDYVIVNPIEIPVGSGICGHAAKTGRSIIVKDASKDERYIVDDEMRKSEMSVPIIHDGRVIGIIDSEHSRKNFFNKQHLRTIETIASLCAKKIAAAIALAQVKKAEAEVEALNNRMRDFKFKNLRLQMNPHFLFNILTTIKHLVVSGQTRKAGAYLDIFSGFLRSLLYYADETVVSLREELHILKLYIELESACLDESFTWHVQVADSIDPEEVQVPFMLLQPFVENAIHHGLLPKQGEKRFSISIDEYDNEHIRCVIEDNGIGRSAAAAANEKNLQSVIHKSKGIDIVKQRLELMRLKTAKQGGVNIEDLFDHEIPCGTRVNIIISYYNKEEV